MDRILKRLRQLVQKRLKAMPRNSNNAYARSCLEEADQLFAAAQSDRAMGIEQAAVEANIARALLLCGEGGLFDDAK